jgi:2-oxoglutarate ferredoxin oxidoreductase subunit beta
MFPLKLYMTMGVSFIASHYSSKPRVLADYIKQAMNHKGFSIVHVQSPCTTYNDTYDAMKGDPKKGIPGTAWEIPADHDPSSRQAAMDLLDRPGIPLGLIYREEQPTLQDRQKEIWSRARSRTPEQILASYAL